MKINEYQHASYKFKYNTKLTDQIKQIKQGIV